MVTSGLGLSDMGRENQIYLFKYQHLPNINKNMNGTNILDVALSKENLY